MDEKASQSTWSQALQQNTSECKGREAVLKKMALWSDPVRTQCPLSCRELIMPQSGFQSRGGQIIRVHNATRPRCEIGVRNAPRPRGRCPQRNASAKKFSESAVFRAIFRVFRVFFRVFHVFFRVFRVFSAFSAFFSRFPACQKNIVKI